MKRILFLAELVSSAKLAKAVALENPNIIVDYIGSCINGPKNLNHIEIDFGNFNSYIDSIAEFLKTNINDYEFIYANELIYQNSQTIRNIIENSKVSYLLPDATMTLLETKKIYTKFLLTRLEIPNPSFSIIDSEEDFELMDWSEKYVCKVEGIDLPTGHGTFICSGNKWKSWYDKIKKLNQIIFVEDFVKGQEISVQILSNGDQWVLFGVADDYKKIGEKNSGINCTSAGCVSTPGIDKQLSKNTIVVIDKIIKETKYVGFMSINLIIDQNTVWVLEINSRPGNPELACIIDRIESKNILKNLLAASRNDQLEKITLKETASYCVNLLHKDYSWKAPEFVIRPNLLVDLELEFYFPQRFNLQNNYYGSIFSNDFKKIYNYLSNKDLGTYRYRTDLFDISY